jgi:hypothetical protein
VAVATGRGSVGPPGLKSRLESTAGSGVFAVRSLRRIRFICLSNHLPHDDSREPTATHTLQESRRVCEPIAWRDGRGDFARRRVIKCRHRAIIAIANTPEPSVEGGTKPPLPTSPPSLRDRGEGKEKGG